MGTPKIALNSKLQDAIADNQMDNCADVKRILGVIDQWMSDIISDNGIGCGATAETKMKILSNLNIIKEDYKCYLYDNND